MAETGKWIDDADWEAILAAVVQRLVRLDRLPAALALAEARWVGARGFNDWREVEVHLEVPGDQFDALTDRDVYENEAAENDFGETYEVWGTSVLASAFTSVLPPRVSCRSVEVKIRTDPVPETWRDDFKASVGRGPVNQGNVPGVPPAKFETKDGLRYRSMAEIQVAAELKRRELIFFPLPGVSLPGRSRVQEPDFLVIHGGRVGVLEIHGSPWHPASRAAEDHAKAMPYRLAGAVHVIEDADDAFKRPEQVVDRLLALMEQRT